MRARGTRGEAVAQAVAQVAQGSQAFPAEAALISLFPGSTYHGVWEEKTG